MVRFIRRWPLYTSMQRKRYVYPVELDARLQRAFIMLFCNNCGAKLEPEDKFCGNCGAPVTQQKMFNPGKEILRTSPPPPAAHTFAQSTKRHVRGEVSFFGLRRYIVNTKLSSLGGISLGAMRPYQIKNANGNLLGYAKKKVFSWGDKFWFEDPDGRERKN